MLPISVCMIAKNEDHHIEECLKRLRPCRFEIIVVDTGSVDRTVEMAHKYTDKVYHFAWCDDFSVARNFSIAQASNDWVLVIDCDEYLEKVNLADLEDLLGRNTRNVGLLTRNNPYMVGSERSIMSERIGRLFNKKYCHYEGSIHEQVCTLDGHEPDTFNIPLTFYHEGYVAESEVRMRATRNIEMLLHDLQTKGPSSYLYFQLGQNYLSLQDMKQSATYYEKGLALQPDCESAFLQRMVETYGYCLLSLEEYDKATDLLNHYKRFSDSADFVYLSGMIYLRKGDTDNAITAFKRATSLDSVSREGTNSYHANYNIGKIYDKKGDLELAMSYYMKCFNFEPAQKRIRAIKAMSGK